MHGKGEAQGSNTSADMRRRRQIVRARPGPLRYSKSALPNHEDSELAGRAETQSQHPLPSAIRRRHVCRIRRHRSHCRGAHRQHAAGRRPAGLRQFLQLSGPFQETRRAQASRPGRRDIIRDGSDDTGGRQEGSSGKGCPEKTGPKGSVYAIVSLPDQHITVYDATGRIARSRVSTGQAGHRTPSGVFSVIGKSRWHRSNIYSGAPMPWMQRITWSGIAMHAGVVPGLSGFARLHPPPAGFAPQMFGLTKMGARVVIAPRDIEPVEFSHPCCRCRRCRRRRRCRPAVNRRRLPRARSSSPARATPPSTTAGGARGARDDRLGSGTQPDRLCRRPRRRALPPTSRSPTRPPRTRSPPPRLPAPKHVRPSTTCARPRRPLPLPKHKLPPSTRAWPRRWRSRLPRRRRRRARRPMQPTKPLRSRSSTRAQAALDEARAREAAKSPAAFAAVEAWKRAVAASEAAANLVGSEAAGARAGVGVHQQEGRPHLHPPGLEGSLGGAGHLPRSRPSARHPRLSPRSTRRRTARRCAGRRYPCRPRAQPGRGQAQPRAKGKPDAADRSGRQRRKRLPARSTASSCQKGARERIAELLWTGGSLIVSDHPRSGEMSEYSDFIVLTR